MAKDRKQEHKNNNDEALPLPYRLIRWTFWIGLFCVVWWLVAGVVPAIPTPLHAVKSLLSLAKDVSDDVYVTINREGLEEAARKVFAAAEETSPDPNDNHISVEKREKLPAIPLREDSALRAEMKGISTLPYVGGRVINILLTGIDSRLSVRDARADAIHLVTINPDSAVVEILSIPRDTYCDLSYPDTTTFNVIANARALGHAGFQRRIEELAKRGPIKYYAEVGFSQAMGVLEILGYNDPVSTLKFLRTRKALPGGDIQRSHNQANFLRQNLIDKFNLLTGATGDLILTAGLTFVETNLTKEFCQGLLYALQQQRFPHHRADAVRLRMLPMYKIRLKEMVADSATIASTLERNRRILNDEETHVVNVTEYLRRVNRLATADTTRPDRVIHRLKRLNEQHAWLQIQNLKDRRGIRDTLTTLLERAYRRKGMEQEAEKVIEARRAEDLLLHKSDEEP